MKILDRLFPRRFVARSLASHLSAPWAIDAGAMRLAVDEARERIAATSAETVRALAMGDPEARPMLGGLTEDGCYHVPISGVLIRGDASCARLMGMDATGLEEVERALIAAEGDARCTSICFEVDSPGGTAVGVQEIADMIAASSKRTTAEIAGQCASAAYWLVSQCDEITAERSALVGSIGVFAVVTDTSKAFSEAGVTVHVLRSGPQKGAGVAGTEVTSDQLAARQVVVDDLAALFVGSVAKGRGLSEEAARALATGEEWIASKALAAGLIDAFTAPEFGESEPPSPAVLPDTDPVTEGAALAPSATAAVAAEVSEMELEKLKAELDAVRGMLAANETETKNLKAENETLRASIGEITKSRRTAVIDKHASAGRVTPAMRAQIEANGAQDPDTLDAFLASLPVQVRPNAAGVSPETAQAEPVKGAIDMELVAKAAKLMNRDPKEVAANANVIAVSFGGEIHREGGAR